MFLGEGAEIIKLEVYEFSSFSSLSNIILLVFVCLFVAGWRAEKGRGTRGDRDAAGIYILATRSKDHQVLSPVHV